MDILELKNTVIKPNEKLSGKKKKSSVDGMTAEWRIHRGKKVSEADDRTA